MPQTLAILRAHIREHNRTVLSASAATLLVAALAWAALYAFGYWCAVLYITVRDQLNAQLPHGYGQLFFYFASGLTLLALLDRWLFRHTPDHEVERPLHETLLDLALFLPRLSFVPFEHLTIHIRLAAPDAAAAARLLDLLRARGRLAVEQLPLDFPDSWQLRRILRALTFSQLVDMRESEGSTWLFPGSLAPESLRLAAQDAQHDAPRVRRAPVFKDEDALPRPQRQLPARDRDDF